MQSNKREGVSTTISDKKQKTCISSCGEEFGSSSDSGQGVWSMLSEEVASNIAETVVSLASFDRGNSMFFACTGIIIDYSLTTTTASILTSLSLIKSIDDDSETFLNRKIKVCLPNNLVAMGWLKFYDVKCNIAIVNIKAFPVLRTCLEHQQLKSQSEVVAVGRCFSSGKLMATTGMLIDNPSEAYSEELEVSTCEITMTGVGGPLIGLDGDFVGMNFYDTKVTPFLPKKKILELLMQCRKIPTCCVKCERGVERRTGRRFSNPPEYPGLDVRSRLGKNPSLCTICDPEGQTEHEDKLLGTLSFLPRWPQDGYGVGSIDERRNVLRSRNYPFPLLEDRGGRLFHTFEDKFCEDIWWKLTEKVASHMSQSVVSLASFIARFFACTGIFIDCTESTTRILTSASLVRTCDDNDTIIDNLKIEVCLPDKQYTKGTLQHYNLHYNIAVVSITGFSCTRTAQIYDQVQIEPHGEVVAVGKIFEYGILMAASGIVTHKASKINCKELMISTCKITKAGIGGPLIDFDGNFIGVNFFGLEETPYVPSNIILELLRNFDGKGTGAAHFAHDQNPTRWPVPKPYWCYPSFHIFEEDPEDIEPQRFD
ncbi:hypothetical protein BRADI_2g03130v3 [Brachypodium distachyon]|uniref:Uncharacterized protein n=2 Tax=Brachypodium distachyon TaxID=15368 RepID=A0A2K2D6L0_BRADI|nr:hypothetical protein BRADI_2g03130v3 [Brachypodium distachyon]